MKLSILFCLFLSSCTVSSPWEFDSIAVGNSSYDSNRLVYHAKDNLSEANIEFFYTDGNLSAYVASPSRRLSQGPTTPAKLTVGTETWQEELDLHEGKMRARLPDAWAVKALDALKDGQEIAIMVGTIDQTIEPEQFSGLYEKLAKGSFSILETFQGTAQ